VPGVAALPQAFDSFRRSSVSLAAEVGEPNGRHSV